MRKKINQRRVKKDLFKRKARVARKFKRNKALAREVEKVEKEIAKNHPNFNLDL